MKKIILSLVIVFPLFAFCQTDTGKIDQFCELTAQGRIFSNKITIDIDFGEGRSMFSFKDTRIKDELSGKVRKFKSTVDALNYLGAKGWKLLNAFPVSESAGLGGTQNIYHFFFVKTFDRSDLIENESEEKK
jgi:hypothetical protein